MERAEFGGCEASRGIAQASAGREMSYMGPRLSRTRRCQKAKAARKCGDVGRGNRVGWLQVVGNGRARFGAMNRGKGKLKREGKRPGEVGGQVLRERRKAAERGNAALRKRRRAQEGAGEWGPGTRRAWSYRSYQHIATDTFCNWSGREQWTGQRTSKFGAVKRQDVTPTHTNPLMCSYLHCQVIVPDKTPDKFVRNLVTQARLQSTGPS
ncbi:hypothetical protein EDB89DRAFT_2240054 [Lactarius sanguifluus]|nr:hypothetical protein EDB89DRAFT_2240054 [Lactarius sanguifluus]